MESLVLTHLTIPEVRQLFLQVLTDFYSTLPKGETSNPDRLLTAEQAAELLTLQLSTIYGLVSRKEIDFMKRGKRLYFSEQKLREWLATGRKQADENKAPSTTSSLRKKGANRG